MELVSPELFDRLISILKSEGEDRSIADICKSIGISIDDLMSTIFFIYLTYKTLSVIILI